MDKIIRDVGDEVTSTLRGVVQTDGRASVRALGGEARVCAAVPGQGVLFEDLRVTDLVYSLAYASLSRGEDWKGVANDVLTALKDEVEANPDAPVTLDRASSALYMGVPELRTALDAVNFRIDLQSRASTMTEGSAKCRRCGSTDTNYIVRQVRCADEPPTTFLMCNTCGRGSCPTGDT